MYWFRMFPQFPLGSKPLASSWGKAPWRRRNWPWIRHLTATCNFNPAYTCIRLCALYLALVFLGTVLCLHWVGSVFLQCCLPLPDTTCHFLTSLRKLLQRSGLSSCHLSFGDGVLHLWVPHFVIFLMPSLLRNTSEQHQLLTPVSIPMSLQTPFCLSCVTTCSCYFLRLSVSVTVAMSSVPGLPPPMWATTSHITSSPQT
jgi:hypothetical protein